MGRPINDITGRRFGKLVAQERVLTHTLKTTDAVWRCLCDCGVTKYAPGGTLRSGKLSSCATGCRRKGPTPRTEAQKEALRVYKRNYQRIYTKRHPDRVRAAYVRHRARWYSLERDRQYKKRYGITLADYDQMLRTQGGRCAICRSDTAGKKGQHFAVDHDHATGRVRGLLCIKCNARLGWFEQHRAAVDHYLIHTPVGMAVAHHEDVKGTQ
jgi:Recombination endonuclease VII